jgi:deazaflavin-dependent oxidoreductase (nitroreductase family)
MLRLHTIGRRTGQDRWTILGYIEDGPNLILLAMNGWADGTPDWWLNLSDNPDARVDLVDGSRAVRADVATGDERSRLWARWADYDDHLDSYAGRRSQETPVVILEPRTQL